MIERGRWIYDRDKGELVPADEYRARKYAGTQVSDLPCPTIISDQIELRSMVDNQIYTSKSALRRSYRENGYVEVGNEEQKPKAPFKPDRKAIKDSVRRAASRVGIPV